MWATEATNGGHSGFVCSHVPMKLCVVVGDVCALLQHSHDSVNGRGCYHGGPQHNVKMTRAVHPFRW